MILLTVAAPLLLGLLAGAAEWLVRWKPVPSWIIAALLSIAVLLLLERLPPVPPIASKHRMFYLAVAFAIALPLLSRLGNWAIAGLGASLVLLGALSWIAGPRVFEWPTIALLLPLPLILGFGLVRAAPKADDPALDLAPRIGMLCAAVGGSVIAMLSGFVGLGQLLGAMAAAIGGTLALRYLALLRGNRGAPGATIPADWSFGGVIAVYFLIVGSLATRPEPIGMGLAALSLLAWRLVPPLPGVPLAIRPFIFGLAAALPAAVAILVAYLRLAT